MFNRREFLKVGILGTIGALAGKVRPATEPDPAIEEEPIWRYSSMGVVAGPEEETDWWENNHPWTVAKGLSYERFQRARTKFEEEQGSPLILELDDVGLVLTWDSCPGSSKCDCSHNCSGCEYQWKYET